MSCLVISLESGDVYSESGNLISIIGCTRIASRERSTFQENENYFLHFIVTGLFADLICPCNED